MLGWFRGCRQIREGVVIVTPLEGEDAQTKTYNGYIKYLFEPCGMMKFLEEKVCTSAIQHHTRAAGR